jgi:UDP-3-O-[3-hydroxymyristoyl] glucosamine N-acyltransferase
MSSVGVQAREDDVAALEAMPFVRALPTALSAAMIARRFAQASVIGDAGCSVSGIAALAGAPVGSLAFCDAASATDALAATHASIVVVRHGTDMVPAPGKAFIAAPDVRALFIELVEWLLPGASRPPQPAPGIAASARIDRTASVSPLATIGADVHIGARSSIGPGAILYSDTQIGDDCVIGPNAVIGYVGMAYHDRSDGVRMFFPHLAGVRMGNRVDVGAQACICRGMLSHTFMGDDAKVGSLVYVSHGVVVGERAWLSAATALAGHSHIADDVLLGIGSVVVDNVAVGYGALVAGGAVVTRHAAPGDKLVGVPAHTVAAMRRFGPTPRD